MRYWIYDEDETPQRFPLRRLLRRVRDVVGPGLTRFDVIRVSGYGATIYQWAEILNEVDSIVLPADMLEEQCAGTKEWFYDIMIQVPDAGISFGLDDSTAMYVDAPSPLTEEIANAFVDVHPE